MEKRLFKEPKEGLGFPKTPFGDGREEIFLFLSKQFFGVNLFSFNPLRKNFQKTNKGFKEKVGGPFNIILLKKGGLEVRRIWGKERGDTFLGGIGEKARWARGLLFLKFLTPTGALVSQGLFLLGGL